MNTVNQIIELFFIKGVDKKILEECRNQLLEILEPEKEAINSIYALL